MADFDSDPAFAAEADMNHKQMRGKTRRLASGHSGEEITVAARGGIDSRFVEELGENEPLLGTPKDVPDQGAGEWEGAKDFEGLPWYKKPSVGHDRSGYTKKSH